ncbi:hypothetical protein [Fusobacterium sp. IOR10]|uniref:hypothetical protein n=1 Tax=Fusobacterium sp. IOR10 TaxID=2665157 RepID=UPI0013D13F78|nr:hypothetical protein [Fusobacterium sp. IOR10]
MIFMSEIVNVLDLLDEKGTTFRYPKDLNGNKNIESNKKINLLELKNNFDHSMSLLYLTDQVLYDYTDEIIY